MNNNNENKFNITLAPGTEKAELIIRQLDEPNEIPVKAPLALSISGVIGSVKTFLETRKIYVPKSHILVDRENMTITLIVNEDNHYEKCQIVGKVEVHPSFQAFGINTGKVWTPAKLGLFCKMNRAFFASREDNMRLVKELMNFNGKVNSNIETSLRENGSKTDNFVQVVESNIPAAFTLKIPIIKGGSVETLEIETFADIDGRDVSFTLLSPGANQAIEEIRNEVIDKEVEGIRGLNLGITIIEV